MSGQENGSEKTSYEWDLFDHLAKGESAWNGVEEASNGIGSGAEDLWNFTASGRHWINNRAHDFVKQIDFSTDEWITNTASILIGYGICAAAGAAATAVGTPIAGGAAVGVCLTSDAITAGGATVDIFDKDNGLWTDSLY